MTDDVVAFAEDVSVVGDRCTDPGARVELDGALLAEGEEVPSLPDDSSSEPVAVVTGSEIAANQPVLDNLTLRSLSAEVWFTGITVRGAVDVRLSGVTSTIGFVGTLRDLDNWSLRLSSRAFRVPGVTTAPATFSGAIVVTNGVPTLSLTAAVPSARVGDVTVTDATLNVTASPETGVAADVAGSIKIGPSTIDGSVSVAFDATGALTFAEADIGLRLRGVSGPGQFIELDGDVSIGGDGDETALSFSGSGQIGDLIVNRASGSLTVLGNTATFVGLIDVVQGSTTIRYNGSIVWDGVTASMPWFTLEAGLEYSGVLDDGQIVKIAGQSETTVHYGGVLRTRVTGDIRIGSLVAVGSVIVQEQSNGTKLVFDADLSNPDFEATLRGDVLVRNGRAERVELDARVRSMVVGDVELADVDLSIRSEAGAPMDISVSGRLAVGQNVDANAWLDLQLGPDGGLLKLAGRVEADLDLDGFVLDASAQLANGATAGGDLVATPEKVTITLVADLSYEALELPVAGTFTSTAGEQAWRFDGTASGARFGPIRFNRGEVRVWSNDPRIVSAGFNWTWAGVKHNVGATLKLGTYGSCDGLWLSGGLLAKLALPFIANVIEDGIGCPVDVTTGPPLTSGQPFR